VSGTVRAAVIARVADHVVGQPASRVAIDGITAAGKTTFADELAIAIRGRGRPVIRLSMDGFHHPRAHRHRQGRDSATGYYQDAYDFQAFARLVLDPLGPGGSRVYCRAIIDLATDSPIDPVPVIAAPAAVLIVDGSFLQRAELAGRWDEVIYLDTSFAVARARGARRDAAQFGGVDAAESAYRSRYHAAGQLYLDEADPLSRASIVIGHDDPSRPVLRRIGRVVRRS
jgi:uridine kinase